MEKYAIDIDKVLDEFEENEALNTGTIQPVESESEKKVKSFMTPDSAETFLKSSTDSESFCPSLIKDESQCDNQKEIENSLILQNKSINQSVSSSTKSYSELGSTFEENSSDVRHLSAANFHDNFFNSSAGKDSKIFNYDIFYKQTESDCLIHDITSVNRNLPISVSEESDSLEDEVLCVSMQEIMYKSDKRPELQPEVNILPESEHVTETVCSSNSIQNEDVLKQSNSMKLGVKLESELAFKNIFSSDKISNTVNDNCLAAIQSEKCDKDITEVCVIQSLGLERFKSDSVKNSKEKDISLDSDLYSTTSGDSDLNTSLQVGILAQSNINENCEKFLHNVNVSDIKEHSDALIRNSAKNIYLNSSESYENSRETYVDNENFVRGDTKIEEYNCDPDELVKKNINLVTCDVKKKLEDSVKNEELVFSLKNPNSNSDINISCSVNKDENKKISNKESSQDNASFSEPWLKSTAACAFNSRDSPNISQDDDSGVSSQEDISGNSPTELPDNHTSNSSCSEKISSDKIADSNCTLRHDPKNIVEKLSVVGNHSNNPSCEDHEKNLTLDCLEEAILPDEAHNDFLVKLSPVVNSKFEQTTNETDEQKLDEISVSVQIKEGVLSVREIAEVPNLNDCNCNESYDISDVISTTDIPIKSNSDVIEVNESLVPECTPEKNNIASAEDIKTDENVVSFDKCDMKSDELSLRLQRPTSLNLPSLQLTSEVQDDELLNLELNEKMPSVTPINEESNEVSCIKQNSQIGLVKPYWIPDAEAPNCMHCALKFTVIRRRHHCRACGKVLCSKCCNQRAHLVYMNKEDRICQPCAEILISNSLIAMCDQLQVSPDSLSSSSCGSSPNYSIPPEVPLPKPGEKTIWRPHPNNPDDYCSTIPPLQQMELSGQKPPPTVMVPIGVLKRGNKRRREPKQVIFSDGIRPGGDLTDLTEPIDTVPIYKRTGRKRMDKIVSDDCKDIDCQSPSLRDKKKCQKRILVSDKEGALPPIILHLGDEDEETIDWDFIFQRLQDEEQRAVKFILLKNLHIFVKLIDLDCCYGKECWCFTSNGFSSVGQDEIMVLLERVPEEKTIPRDIFKFFTTVFDNACKGTTIDDLGHLIFPEKILDSTDHRGFFFIRPSFQCLSKLIVPSAPYLVAILIHKWEVPWAKVFPLRLMLRLGAECRYYPCSLVSVRHRKPVFFEIGQTIMSVLADLRNYQFTLPIIPGLVVHMEEKKTCVNIPRNRYDKIMKVLKTNNVEHVISLGSNFSTEADSHLVCMQKEDGDYITQAINIENTVRKVTGASFIVFSGALKSSSGLSAKFSIVEDGLLIQIPQETILSLHVALREMRDLTIECGRIGATEPEEIIIVQWTRDEKKFNIGVRSPIDGKSLEGVSNLRIHTSTDYAGENYLIRWTEIFFIETEDNISSLRNEVEDPCHMAETVAQSCCMALTPYLDQLAEADLTKIGLRIALDTETDKVGYDIGSCGKPLPSAYMNLLDSGLIPVILRLSTSPQNEKLSFELIFHILLK